MAAGLLLTLLASAQLVQAFARAGEGKNGPGPQPIPAAAPGNGQPSSTLIVVNGKPLTGPNSSAQQRGGRLFLPVAAIATALGDAIQSDPTARLVTVRRQNGIVADFSALLNQVRESGSVTLTVSNTADLVFPPAVEELMLPVEIVSTLLDVSVRRDEGQAIEIARGGAGAETVRAGTRDAKWELFQVDFDYNLNRYSSFSSHNLSLRGTGRIGANRFTFLTDLTGGAGITTRPVTLHGGNFRLERPNGQSFAAGDFGTGTELQFMSATVRGAAAELPLGPVRFNAFGGRTISGVVALLPLNGVPIIGEEPIKPRSPLAYDTNMLGASVTVGSSAASPNGQDLIFSGGAMHFSGPNRRGDLATGSLRYAAGRTRLQADLAAGTFAGISRDQVQVDGVDTALSVAGSFQVTDDLIAQGRYVRVGANFLSAQNGLQDPITLAAGGLTWKPKEWLTTSVSVSNATRPGLARDFNRYVTGTLNLTPGRRWPTIFFSHTGSSTPQLRNAAFTLASATKEFTRFRLFVNATRVKTFGPAALNAQTGVGFRVSESNTFEFSQGMGNNGLLNGSATWQMAGLFNRRLSLSGGLGYQRSGNSPFRTTEQLSASLRLPRQTAIQVSYLQSQTGPTLLLSTRGLLFSSRHAEQAVNGPVAAVAQYGAVTGRVYQDVNLNGRFDPDTDTPQADVKVRVDGTRYVMTSADGIYHLDSVERGDHAINLDLLSVRADLTMLDGAEQNVSLQSARDSVVDFRLVRTGRLSGVVWQDLNANGRVDDGEPLLSDIRVVTASGRDTLTDANGYFMIGDLPPGEYVVLIDEKTLPELTRSLTGSLTIKIQAGAETGDVLFPVTVIPAEVKRFPAK
jgi:hypothetical protein